MGEILGWLKLAEMEKTSPPRDLAALRQAVQSTAAILSWVDVVSRSRAAACRASLEQLAQTLEDMAQVLRKGAIRSRSRLRLIAATSPLPAASGELWTDMRDLLARVRRTAGAGFIADATGIAASRVPSAPIAFTNPEYLRYALKTTAAAMFCYVLYSLLDWPGIHTCFITCYIVSLGTTAETVEKFTLRISGCLIGAAAGIAAIVYVIPSLTSIGALLVVVFLGALASAWVAAGSARIAYAGFQIAFAFFLCVIQGPVARLRPHHRARPHHRHPARQSDRVSAVHPSMARECGKAHRSGDRAALRRLSTMTSATHSCHPALARRASARSAWEH